MELDNEHNRTVLLRESDPFMPILPSPERQKEFLEEGLKTPPSTPIHSPHAFLKEDRWLFSPPPMLTLENTNLDKSETKTGTTSHVPHPTPELVRKLTNSCIPYVDSLVSQKSTK